MADDFLRMFILRHVICVASMHMHRATRARGERAIPASQPQLGNDVLRNEPLLESVLQLAAAAGASDQFHAVSD